MTPPVALLRRASLLGHSAFGGPHRVRLLSPPRRNNGSKAIIASAAENESALIGSDSARLETDPPTISPRSFSGELVSPLVSRESSLAATSVGLSLRTLSRCIRDVEVAGSNPVIPASRCFSFERWHEAANVVANFNLISRMNAQSGERALHQRNTPQLTRKHT